MINPVRKMSISFQLVVRGVSNNSHATDLRAPRVPNNSHATDLRAPRVQDTSYSDVPRELDSNRNILFIGSGNFSLPLAFVNKRTQSILKSNLGSQAAVRNFTRTVVASEYKTEKECLADPKTAANISRLKSMGVESLYGVDGTRLDEQFAGHTFKRIQWDCPDINTPFCDSRNGLAKAIKKTALAASHLLKEGSTLHFTLITPFASSKTWQAVHYQIFRVEDAGYYLNEGAPRISGPRRYTSYTHQKTKGDQRVEAAALGEMSEFIFVRHNTQRTPPRYMGTYRGYQQTSITEGLGRIRVPTASSKICIGRFSSWPRIN